MKLIAFILIASTATCLFNFQNQPIVTREGNEPTWFQIASHDPLAQNEGSKYDKCLNQVDDLVHFSVGLLKVVFDGQFEKVLPKVALLVQYARTTVQCFQNATEPIESLSIDPECAIEHLQHAGALLKQILKDIAFQKWKEVPVHFNEMIVVLQDIKNC